MHRLPDGRCKCGENQHKVIDKVTEELKCVECFKCRGECMARKHLCENYEAFPEDEVTMCVRPGPNQHISFGELESCGKECSKNEFEFQKCHCNNKRRCVCPKDRYYTDSSNNCKLCSKCFSKDHQLVGFHQCLNMPVEEVYI